MLSLHAARTWHQVFSSKLYHVLVHGGVSEPDIARYRDDKACEFGQWLDRIRPVFGQYPRYNSLDIAHTLFHRAVGELLRMKRQTHRIADEGLASFRNLAELVDHCLNDFEPEYAARRLGYRIDDDVVQFRQSPETSIKHARWSQNPTVAVDQQHVCILALLSQLHLCREKTTKSEDTVSLMSSLQHIFTEHFELEERLLTEGAFSGREIERHREGHRHILEIMVDLFLSVAHGIHYRAEDLFQTVLETFMVDVRDLDEHLLLPPVACNASILKQSGSSSD